jgi:hypothetical protein
MSTESEILATDISACDDMARLSIHGHARPETWAKLAGYLRELNQHRVARNADTWPMCEADTERMKRAAIAIETLTREREAAFNIATRRTEEHMQFQRERDAAREALKDAAHRVRWLMQFVTDTPPIEAELAKWDALVLQNNQF